MSLSGEKAVDDKKSQDSGYQEDLELLRKCNIFQNVDLECLKLLAMLSKRIDFIEGDQLIVQGEDDGKGYLILSGSVSAMSDGDKEQRVVREYHGGEFIGSCALLGKMVRLFTVVASESTTVLCLRRDEFVKVMRQQPENFERVVRNVLNELSEWDRVLIQKMESEEQVSPTNLGISLL